ncbi:MAG: Txe/YoeB family addiction module toxin [Phormidesmis sp. CAN_BIN44]|nr:Txe/YoeB family addiction module toxin [Phormidesmis sp. CAN_BIN44]
MRNIAFDREAFKQFNTWAIEDRKIYAKVVDLIEDILRDPFKGLGNPEPLKHDLKGYWSRRITDEHRLIYRVTEEQVFILGCKFHYE